MNKENRMFKTFEERREEVQNALRGSSGFWINRSIGRRKYVNKRRVSRLWNALRYIEHLPEE